MVAELRLDDRVAVVTGGGRGIGFAIAELFIEAGAQVVIAELDDQLGRDAARKLGERAHQLRLDVADSAAVTAAAAAVQERCGRIDILVNNAGVSVESSALDTSDELWRRQMAVNLDGVFFCCRAFGKYMVEQRSGTIVNLSSIAALVDVRPQTHIGYSVAKAGVAQLSRVLASQWAEAGIRVNALAPGYVATDMSKSAIDEGRLDTWLSLVPARRLLQPREVALAVLFLASGAASSITGQTVVGDLGYTAW